MRAASWLAPVLAIVGLIAGCSSGPDPVTGGSGFTRVYTPQPPLFVNGSMAVLLTNASGFSARAVLTEAAPAFQSQPVTGQLLGREGKLLFAPDPTDTEDRTSRRAGFSFLWDVKDNSGYLLCEVLQGCAPRSSSLRVTNVITRSSQAAPERVDGHPCELERVEVRMNDGGTRHFEVWRALDLQGLPVRISATNSAAPVTLTLSRIRLAAPAAEVFVVPDGFTTYSSAEALVDEVAARQLNLRRKGPLPADPLIDTTLPPPR